MSLDKDVVYINYEGKQPKYHVSFSKLPLQFMHFFSNRRHVLRECSLCGSHVLLGCSVYRSHVLNDCSLYRRHVLHECSLYRSHVLRECSLYGSHLLRECPLYRNHVWCVFAVPQNSRIAKKYFRAPRKSLLQIQRLDRRTEMWYSPFASNNLLAFWCRIHLWFRYVGGLYGKSMTSSATVSSVPSRLRAHQRNIITTRWPCARNTVIL